MKTKQIIVARKDLGMSCGKLAAQVSHASMSFLTKSIYYESPNSYNPYLAFKPSQSTHIKEWLKDSFTKVVLEVNSEEELEEIHKKSLEKGLISHLIIDNGRTEFNNVATKTCVAIGPARVEDFSGLTDGLKLYK